MTARIGNGKSDQPSTFSLQLKIPPLPRYVRSARGALHAFGEYHHVAPRDLESLTFALGEALANAIEHSRSSDVIEVRCRIEDDKIVATIVDSGIGFRSDRTPGAKTPEPLSERGRGLPIMRSCSDIFAVHSVPGRGTAVVLGRYLRSKVSGRGENGVAS